MIYGVDVSNWQAEQFPLTLNDGQTVDFAIIQVTRGASGLNEKWKAQADWARRHGLAVGFYHFGEAGGAQSQADRFVNTVGVLWPGESLWYDWENKGTVPAPSNTEKDIFIRQVKGRLPGRKVGLYCNVDFWKNKDTTSYCGDALWIASWSSPVVDPPIEASWTVHQFSDGGGKLDHDCAQFASREDMKVWGGKPEDPAATLIRIVKEVRADGIWIRGKLLDLELALQGKANAAQYDHLKESVDQLRVLVGEIDTSALAVDLVTEIARRLES